MENTTFNANSSSVGHSLRASKPILRSNKGISYYGVKYIAINHVRICALLNDVANDKLFMCALVHGWFVC